MAKLTDEFILAWDSLAGESKMDGWRSIPIPCASACRMMAARRFPGNRESLLVNFPTMKIPISEKLPDGRGFVIERVDPYSDGKTWLALSRKESGSIELFVSMVADLVGTLGSDITLSEGLLLTIFLGRVKAWQEFMRKGTQGLEPEAEIGLIGELSFLTIMIELDIPAASALEAWVGPINGIQDFEIGTGAVEVKATVSRIGFPIKIGSLEQLDDSIRQPLFLAGARLSQIESGMNLPEFVSHSYRIIKGDMEAERIFSDKLLAAGYFNLHDDRYARRFIVTEIRIMEVEDGFPRLTSANVPAEIRRAQYEIDFDRIIGETISPREAFKKLGVL